MCVSVRLCESMMICECEFIFVFMCVYVYDMWFYCVDVCVFVSLCEAVYIMCVLVCLYVCVRDVMMVSFVIGS